MSDFSNFERAEVLTQALPYIRKYSGKTVVVKYGGNAMINEDLKQQVMEDIVLLWLVGVKIVLVHGGGPEISEMLRLLGKKTEFVNGLRVSDKDTVEVAQMVLAGKINKTLVNMLEMQGGKAIGISGIDGHLIQAKIKDEKLGFVGDVTRVNAETINDLLEKGYIPVISTIGCDDQGNIYNINGDTAAACIAGAIKAESFILMTDVPGVLRDINDPTSKLTALTPKDLVDLIGEGVIAGGMIPKVDCCIKAIEEGVNRVFIMDGRIPHSILMELLTDEGAGTMVVGA